MDYHLYVYKEDFDFLNDDLPGNLKLYFGDQLERARELLKHRNLAEIHHALDSLDWILREGGRLEMKHSIAVANEKGHCFISRVKALKLYAEITDISHQTSLPNATWSDYFTVLTLAYSEAPNPQRLIFRQHVHPGFHLRYPTRTKGWEKTNPKPDGI